MKKLAAVFSIAIAIVFSLVADTETIAGYTWTYRIIECEVEIHGRMEAHVYGDHYQFVDIPSISPTPFGLLTIPNTLGGYPVTRIGEKALASCYGLACVVIPDSVTSIEMEAFVNCSGLVSVTIPDSVTTIKGLAFSKCSGLESVTIPNSVMRICQNAFYSCTALTNVTMPGHMALYDESCVFETYRTPGPFQMCTNLTSITITTNPYNMNTMFPEGLITNIIISSGVKIIGDDAFSNFSALKCITLPSSTTVVGSSAFSNCSSLESVMIPNGVTCLSVGKNAFHNDTSVSIEDKGGYVFCGWTNEVGEVIADPFHSGTENTVAPCWKKIVNVTFDPNGGYGEMVAQTMLEGDDMSLVVNSFERSGYSVIGWAKSAKGEPKTNVVAADDGSTLYAVWKPDVPSIMPTSGTIFSNASQDVAILGDAADAVILYTTDGSDPAANGMVYKGAFMVYESCTVRAVVRGAGRYSDEASVTLTRAEGLSEAANLYGYLMETDGGYPWTVVTDVSHDGVSCVRSGAIGNGGTTHLTASVRKAGTVSFWWKAACEDADVEDGETYYYDYGVFLVDDVEKAWIAGHDTGWRKVEVNVPSGGKHVLRWEYRKDGATSYAPDCVWVDQVQWIPADGGGYTLTTPEPVPYTWLSGYGLGLDSDFETAAKLATGKVDPSGRVMSVWQDYVAGTDPTNVNSVFSAAIEMVGDIPNVTWSPNLNTNGIERIYTIWGKTNLTDDVEWMCPTNSGHRFFKVEVELP